MNNQQMKSAERAMIAWLADPHEIGKAPSKIACAGEFDLHGMHYYFFKFKRGLLSNWLLGVCGGYEENSLEHCGHVFSEMQPYHEEAAFQDAAKMVEMIRSYWMEQAKKVSQEKYSQTYYKEECEYKRYIVGTFKSDAYVNKMLKEYSELCIDSPRITEFNKSGKWTIIPCPAEMIGRGDFYNLMNWLSQEGEEASALALHDEAGYYAVTDKDNSAGDTVIVHFENGGILRWNLPEGTGDDHAYSVIRKSGNNGDSIKDFLSSIGAEELIKHFDL